MYYIAKQYQHDKDRSVLFKVSDNNQIFICNYIFGGFSLYDGALTVNELVLCPLDYYNDLTAFRKLVVNGFWEEIDV